MTNLQTIDKTVAEQLIDELPSFSELANHELMNKIVSPFEIMAWKGQPNEWELIVFAVDNICQKMLGRHYHSSYSVVNSDPANGGAYLLDNTGDKVYVDGYEFFAITKLFFVTWLEMPMSDKAYDLYLELKEEFYEILD